MQNVQQIHCFTSHMRKTGTHNLLVQTEQQHIIPFQYCQYKNDTKDINRGMI